MMQRWEPDMVRFMRDASEHETYNQEIARIILPHLSEDSCVCDAGCGLGYLSLELAKHVQHVTAVDLNRDALDVLSENCADKHVHNISLRCGDIETLPPLRKYDAMVFCFFGCIEEILRIAARQCAGDVLIISRNYSQHRFSVREHGCGRGGYLDISHVLSARQIPFHAQMFSLEFGQPLRSWEDARRFFALYSKDEKEMITDEFLESRIVRTKEWEFPYFMPHRRDIGVIHLKAQDIRQHTYAESTMIHAAMA